MVVPNRMVKGGIAAVVNGYRGSQLEKDYEITYVESYKDGSKFDKLLKGICGYFHFAYVFLKRIKQKKVFNLSIILHGRKIENV